MTDKIRQKVITSAALAEEEMSDLELAREFAKFYRTCIIAVMLSEKEERDYSIHSKCDDSMNGHETAVEDAMAMACNAFGAWKEWVEDEKKVAADFTEEVLK